MELKSKRENYYTYSNSVQRIIIINIIVFIFPLIIKTILHLFSIDNIDIVSLFTIESDLTNLIFSFIKIAEIIITKTGLIVIIIAALIGVVRFNPSKKNN